MSHAAASPLPFWLASHRHLSSLPRVLKEQHAFASRLQMLVERTGSMFREERRAASFFPRFGSHSASVMRLYGRVFSDVGRRHESRRVSRSDESGRANAVAPASAAQRELLEQR